MMRNPLLAGVKKFILKDKSIKNLVLNSKIIEKAIEKIEGLARLAEPTKRKVKNLLETKESTQFNQRLEVHDDINIDMYYVLEGNIRFTFKPLSN